MARWAGGSGQAGAGACPFFDGQAARADDVNLPFQVPSMAWAGRPFLALAVALSLAVVVQGRTPLHPDELAVLERVEAEVGVDDAWALAADALGLDLPDYVDVNGASSRRLADRVAALPPEERAIVLEDYQVWRELLQGDAGCGCGIDCRSLRGPRRRPGRGTQPRVHPMPSPVPRPFWTLLTSMRRLILTTVSLMMDPMGSRTRRAAAARPGRRPWPKFTSG